MAPLLHSYEDALEYCRELGMRLSQQRQFILKLLWETNQHLSARDIYDHLRQQGKEIGYTSVYQNLRALSHIGVIERIDKSEGSLYSHPTYAHGHVYCLDNGEIVDVRVTLSPETIADAEAQSGFKVFDYHIEFLAHQLEDKTDPTSLISPENSSQEKHRQ